VSPDQAFTLLSLSVLPWWAVWLAAPRSRLALRAASHGLVFVALSLCYALLLVATLATGPDAARLDFDSVRAGLSTPVGFLTGWTHYIVFDLFVGAWIVREARRLDVEARPYLFFALLAGPLGLGSFLVRRALRLRSFASLGETDLA
jgi:hypothetical protein